MNNLYSKGKKINFNIVTFHRSYNYGAVLQAYALQEYIKSLGYSVGVYDGVKETIAKVGGIKGKILKVIKKTNKKANFIKEKKYKEFVETELCINKDFDSDVFVAGSDQVWNAMGKMDANYFLRFVKNDALKISYAASMGVDKIPKEREKIFRDYIRDFDFISVREEGAKECIGKICDKDIEVHVDPTLLLRAQQWQGVMEPVSGLPEKYTFVYLLHVPKNVNKLLKWLKKQTKTEIVLVDGQGIIQGVGCKLIKHDIALHDIGPKQFLYLIANAESVVTSSFHGTALSIIFNKEFYSIINPKSPSRIGNLLNLLGLQSVSEFDTMFNRFDKNDWEKVENILNAERERSYNYINSVIERCNQKQNNSLGNVARLSDFCTGCGACENVCPTNCIQMVLNDKGFYQPKIKEKLCINCGKCYNTCYQNKRQGYIKKKSWYGYNKDENVLYNSTSGGVFSSIATKMLENNGVVFGAVYSEDFKDVIFKSTDEVSLEEMRKSKYVVSYLDGIYKKIEKVFDKGQKALFCGTPCQVAALKSYFCGKCDNLVTVDFVCGGLSSLSFWREHLSRLESKYKSKVTSVDFRSKKKGWGKCLLEIQFENGKKYIVREYNDIYYKLFVSHISTREVCLFCGFHDSHCSDITIADFWGYRNAKLNNVNKGVSLIMANTQKGIEYVEKLDGIELVQIEQRFSDYAVQTNNPSIAEISRNSAFLSEASLKGFEKVANENYTTSTMSHIVKWIRNKIKL